MASKHPPLNGRNLAEFYTASEAHKRTVLRAYAKPEKQQKARIIMYDPIRRVLPEYLRSGRDPAVLERLNETLRDTGFSNPEYAATWYRFNRAAAAGLAKMQFAGSFEDVTFARARITVGVLQVNSTADIYGMFVPAGRGKPKRVAVIVNPSGIKLASQEKRDIWQFIECEVAYRAALAADLELDEVVYVDLPKDLVTWHKIPKKRIWAEIDATCERIFRDWRDIRLEPDEEQGTA